MAQKGEIPAFNVRGQWRFRRTDIDAWIQEQTTSRREAAQMLYGTKFLPDYPLALLKLGRFRGTKITGDILDNKQEHLHAFTMVREAIAWLDRTLPLSARFPRGAINREDRLPVPAEALREIVINAVIHRDMSNPSSYVAIAVFDDRIEIHSIGDFPTGIRAELLTQEHRSIPQNPLTAGAFHRTGAIEVWGRGTNRVIEACRAYGIAEPTFTEGSGAVTVPGPSRRAPAGRRPPRDDHPGQAAELDAAVPHHRGRARAPARWLVIGGPACSSWLAARAHRSRRRSR
jgi:predicted HTH transcriptional regulator